MVETKPVQMITSYTDPANPKNMMAIIEFPDEEVHIERRIFDIRTYARLRNNVSHAWERIQPANDFLATLDRDEYSYLVKLFIRAKRDLMQVRDRTTAMNAVLAIDEKVAKTFGKMNLSERLHQHVTEDKRITMPEFTGVLRPQDTPEKTFVEYEYHLINTIIVISKILFPIFGEIINKIQHVEDTYSGVKEIVAFGIVNTLMTRDFPEITKKLLNYISKMVDTVLTDDPMLTYHGITETSLTYDKLAKMVVKNFVNHDLYQDGGNVMRYLAVTIKRAISAETSGSNNRMTYKARILPEMGGDDGRNISLLENAVSTASEPVEIPIIIKISVDRFISDYIVKNNINVGFFEKAVAYYKITSLPPTPINELVVAMFVADRIGSAYCVKYMNMEMMVKIIVIIQMYAMQNDFRAVIPLLSLIPTGIAKTDNNDEDSADNEIIITEGRGDNPINSYINLRSETSHLDDFANFNFEELMSGILKFVVDNVHTFNVAPNILETGDTGNTINDGGIVKYDRNVISELHRFLYHLLISQLPQPE